MENDNLKNKQQCTINDVNSSLFEDIVMKGNFRKMETKEDIQNIIDCLGRFGYNNIEIDKTIRIIYKSENCC